MPTIRDTAYPRLKAIPTRGDLKCLFTPTQGEQALAQESCSTRVVQACFLVLMKTFQKLGYFVALRDVPPLIVGHVVKSLGVDEAKLDLEGYDLSGIRRRHMQIIRDRLEVKRQDTIAEQRVIEVVEEAAQHKEDLVDIVNVAIEELVRQSYELPGFTVLLRMARQARAELNRTLDGQIVKELSEADRLFIDQLLVVDPKTARSDWARLKEEPGSPTLTHLEELISHVSWLGGRQIGARPTRFVPQAKLRQFAAEAKSLDAARMIGIAAPKRYAIAAALVKRQMARSLDDLSEMLIKRMRNLHHDAKEKLEQFRAEPQGNTERLIFLLRDLLVAYQTTGGLEERFQAMGEALGGHVDEIIAECESLSAFADDNYLPFMMPFYKRHRQTLFAVLDQLELVSTTQDTMLPSSLFATISIAGWSGFPSFGGRRVFGGG